MNETEPRNNAWKQAVDWIMLGHEENVGDATCKALLCWLAEAPAHRQAYEQARILWTLTGLMPNHDEQGDLRPGDV